jgi:hypothetical protein
MKQAVAFGARIYREHRLMMRVALGIFVIMAALDFFIRVAVFRDPHPRVVRVPAPFAVQAVANREDVDRRVLEALPAASDAGTGGAAAVEKQVKLLAVFRSPVGATAVVHLVSPVAEEAPIMKLIRVGDELEGWKVASIEARRITLLRTGEEGEQQQELVLFRGKEL